MDACRHSYRAFIDQALNLLMHWQEFVDAQQVLHVSRKAMLTFFFFNQNLIMHMSSLNATRC